MSIPHPPCQFYEPWTCETGVSDARKCGERRDLWSLNKNSYTPVLRRVPNPFPWSPSMTSYYDDTDEARPGRQTDTPTTIGDPDSFEESTGKTDVTLNHSSPRSSQVTQPLRTLPKRDTIQIFVVKKLYLLLVGTVFLDNRKVFGYQFF